MRYSPAPVLAALVLLAGCQADAVAPAPTEIAAHLRADVRTGWIVGPQGRPVQVTFQVVGGRGVFEGDIDLGPADQVPTSLDQLNARLKVRLGEGVRANSVITGSMYRWYPPSGGTGALVPYVIDPNLPDPQRVFDAMNHITSRVSTIRFVARTTETDYVRFVRATDGNCYSNVGKMGGEQWIQLSDGCWWGPTVHELGHALGFWHEQSRCDRDAFVEVLWQNVQPGFAYAFDIHCSSSTTDPDAGTDYHSYDEGSIMHYSPYAFSANGLPTIRSRRGLDHLMGQLNGLSYTDANTLATLYPARRRACCSY